MDPLRWLFVDLNSYFASVEQQDNPALRGRPVAVVPSMVDTTCCLAASYEAKALGIKTGTPLYEAKVRCPSIVFIEADHHKYVRYHHQIVEAVDRCIPVDHVLSIDEMICRLTCDQRQIPVARALAEKVKATIYKDVGVAFSCSVGLAPNRFLAKLGSDMQKPDGLTVIRKEDLPAILYPLGLRDFCGIGPRMEERLHHYGIRTVEHLCSLSKERMTQIWGGIVGERYWSWLRGEDTYEPPTHHTSIGHSHVLEPIYRNAAGAYEIAQKLLAKAALRLRKGGYWTAGLSVDVKFLQGKHWSAFEKVDERQDTPTLLKHLDHLWNQLEPGKPLRVAVTCFPIVPKEKHIPSLFENPKREKLSHVMDQLNETHGKDKLRFASLLQNRGSDEGRIAFNRIPDLNEF